MIRVYPSMISRKINGLPEQPLETHEAHGVTIDQWFRENVPGYVWLEDSPYNVSINGGEPLHSKDWFTVVLDRSMSVDIRRRQKGASLIVAAVAVVAAFAASYLLRPSIPGQTNRNKSAKGSRLLEVEATGNRVKLGDLIPDIAGRVKRYPDYLNAPRRRFVSTKIQQQNLLLCVGLGAVELSPSDVIIGNTPVTQLGSAVSCHIFPPGADVSGHIAHQNWYNAPEVGASTGSAGLRLKSNRDAADQWGGTLTFSGPFITSANGAPNGWASGTKADISIPQQVTIYPPPSGAYSSIAGDLDWLMLAPNVEVRIDQFPGNRYRVASYTDGALMLDQYTEQGWQTVDDLEPGDAMWAVTRPNFDFLVSNTITNGLRFKATLNDDVQADWPGFPSITTADAVVRLDPDYKQGEWSLPFAACPKGEVTSTLEYDIFAPQGLGHVNDGGGVSNSTRTIELRYREIGTAAWVTVPTEVVSGQSRDQLGWTFTVDLPRPMRPEVQIRRRESESNSTQDMDRLEWYGLRARIDDAPTSYPGVTVIALQLHSSDELASQTENQVACWPTRILPTRENGVWTEPRPTRDIAPWFAHVAHSAGYTDADIDLVELDRLDRLWKQRDDKYCFIEADDTTVKEAANRCLRAGMAELTINAGKLKPVREGPRTAIQNVYSAQNMTEEFEYSESMPRSDDTDGIDVEYIDGETWTTAEVPCRLPGDQGSKPEKRRADGVPSRRQAYQIGMRARAKIQYQRGHYTFGTELDALNSEYLSYDGLISDVPGEGQSMLFDGGELLENGNYRMNVTEPLDWTSEGDHRVAFRKRNGKMAGPFLAQPGRDEFEVIMVEPAPLPTSNSGNEPLHVYFGPEDTWLHGVLIESIKPNGFESVSVEAKNYDDRVYLYDDALPPD